MNVWLGNSYKSYKQIGKKKVGVVCEIPWSEKTVGRMYGTSFLRKLRSWHFVCVKSDDEFTFLD